MKTRVSAFVGHSFDVDDDQIVRKFLDFLNSIKDMGNGFDWEHAEKAEPRILSEKVKEKMEGKNLFIGIFTKKKRGIDKNKLSKKRWFSNKIITTEDDYDWNTSDWIIQESGYALGKEMDVIFLVEEGLSPVGGLQGDREYIKFSRLNPQDSFTKINQMIGSLMPKEKPLEEVKEVADIPKRQEQEMDRLTETIKDEQDVKPESEWNRQDFEMALMRAIFEKDDKKEKEIFDKYMAAIPQDDDKERVYWQALHLHIRSILNLGNKLEQMKRLASDYPDHPDVRWFLGLMYEKYRNFDQASEEFMLSAEYSEDPNLKLQRLCRGAEARSKAGKYNEAVGIIGNLIGKETRDDSSNLFFLLKALV